MKKLFEEPEITLIRFEAEDIICTSNPPKPPSTNVSVDYVSGTTAINK